MQTVVPLQLRQLGPELLGIEWSDGSKRSYSVRELRLNCHCAHCVDEWTREKILDEAKVPLDIRPKKIEPVGRYAIRFVWSDGHDTGIYTFDLLRKLGTAH
jgi:DUF971 family protein